MSDRVIYSGLDLCPIWAVLSVALIAAAACQSPSTESAGESRSFGFTLIDSVGATPEPGDTTDVFGRVADLEWGPDGNLYVADAEYPAVQIRNRRGEHLRTVPVREGKGPGEISRIGDLSVTSEAIWLASRSARRIVALSRDGEPLHTFDVNFSPTQIAVTDSVWYASSWLMTADSLTVHKFDRSGTRIASLVPKPDNAMLIARAGNFPRMTATADGQLLYTYPYPYRLVRYGHDGQLAATSRGHTPFDDPPRREKDSRVVATLDGSRGLTVAGQGRVMNVVMEDGETWYVDLFDEGLAFQGRVPAEALGVDRIEEFAVGPDGIAALSVGRPVPHIHLYRVEGLSE